jgi:iron-sulfur cluster assembly protein
MLTITEHAAKQICVAAKQGGIQDMALRIAAKRKPDGGIEYAMGFDDVDGKDTRISAHGVDVVVAATSTELLRGAVLDYVELEPGDFQFIFMNPNDAHYVPPKEEGE